MLSSTRFIGVVIFICGHHVLCLEGISQPCIGWDQCAAGALANSTASMLQMQLRTQVSSCSDGDVKAANVVGEKLSTLSEGERFIPYVFFGTEWYPVCGKYFWDNDRGASTICNQLGFTSGKRHRSRYGYPRDAMPIGKCGLGEDITRCTQGGNAWGNLDFESGVCKASERIGVEISCDGYGTGSTTISCAQAPTPTPSDVPPYVELVAGAKCEPQKWLGTKSPHPQTCQTEITARTECSQSYFNHATDGDGNCGCITSATADCKSPMTQRSAGGTRIYHVPTTKTTTTTTTSTITASSSQGGGCCPKKDGTMLDCCLGTGEIGCCPNPQGVHLDCCSISAPRPSPTPVSPPTPTPISDARRRHRQCLGNDTKAPCVGNRCLKIRGRAECIEGSCVCVDESECAVQSDLIFPVLWPVICMKKNHTETGSGGQIDLANLIDFALMPSQKLCLGREDTYAVVASSTVGPWKRTRMDRLMSGDFVLSITEFDQPCIDRIWKNLHLADKFEYELVEIVYEAGILTLTADHVIFIDGTLKAARHARVGSSLTVIATPLRGGGLGNVTHVKVQSIEFKRGRIVNPVTHSGLIVAFGSSGNTGVLVTTTVDSPLQIMLSAARWFHVGKLASYIFPHAFQMSHFLEVVMLFGGGCLTAMPAWLSCCICIFLDCCCGAGFIVVSLFKKLPICLLVAAVATSSRLYRNHCRNTSRSPSCTYMINDVHVQI